MKKSHRIWMACACTAVVYGAIAAIADEASKVPESDPGIERGRRLVKIAGCNDCHSPGYAMSDGKTPESGWLVGDTMGWRGPWGTTYPANLRLLVSGLSEEAWLIYVKSKPMRPPMPSYVFRDMTDDELRSIYKFIRHLGKAGVPAPDYVPPDQEPKPPFVTWPAPPPAAATDK